MAAAPPYRPRSDVFRAALRGFRPPPICPRIKIENPACGAVDRAGDGEYISPTPAAGPEVSRLCGLVFPTSNQVKPVRPVTLLRPKEGSIGWAAEFSPVL